MTKTELITPILDLIAALLRDASTAADEAAEAIAQGRQDLAIGTLLPMEETLPTADALLRAALALHRHPLTGGAA